MNLENSYLISIGLLVALVALRSGGCQMMECYGSAKMIEARSEAKMIEAKINLLTISKPNDTVKVNKGRP